MNSTPEQRLAATTTESPLLIIAGPGAGKTKTLVDRVLYLVKEKQVPAGAIMVATFTEKAAKELVTRISSRADEEKTEINIQNMRIGTLHSIFLNILKEYQQHTRLGKNYKILDDFEQKYLIFRNADRFNKIENLSLLVDGHFGWSFASKIAEFANKAAEENLELEKLSACTQSEVLPVLAEITLEYRKILEEENALDFSLIQTMTWELLKDDFVLNDLREKIQYIMVDEYQDTNRIQEQILLKLAAPKNRICVVGDDDQALYRFRGATVENILRFPEKFNKGCRSKCGNDNANECAKIELTKNFRSHPDIIKFYNKFMQNPYSGKDGNGSWDGDGGEKFRYPKIITHAKDETPKQTNYPGVVRVMGGVDTDSWESEVLDFINTLRQKKILKDYNQIAFLSYSVKSSKVKTLAAFLEKNGVPVFSPRSDMFFERREIMLVLGFYLFLFPDFFEKNLKPADEKNGGEIYAYYEKCQKTFADELRKNPNRNKDLQKFAVRIFKELHSSSKNTDYAFSDLFYMLLQFPLFKELVDVSLSSGVQDLRPVYNLAIFSQLLTRFEALNDVNILRPSKLDWVLRQLFKNYLNFLYDGGLEEYEDFDMTTPPGCVSFMTIHQSKGLEFPVTVVTSLDRSPRKSFDQIDEDIALFYRKQKPWEPLERTKYFDFWRLYYTAFSRAENLLVLSDLDTDKGERAKHQKKCPSKYFDAVYHDVPDWTHLFDKGNTLPVLADVKKSEIKHKYSFTGHVLLYEGCPLQYKFYKEIEFSGADRGSISFGTLVHETIEDIHRTVLEGGADELTKEKIDGFFNLNYAELSKSQNAYLSESVLKEARQNVQRYVDYAEANWQAVKAAEVPVTLQKENFILEGKIDLVRGSDGGIEILDFKTGKKPDVNAPKSDFERAMLDRYKRQLEVYASIVEGRTGEKISRLRLFYTGTKDGSPLVTFEYKKDSVQKTVADITETVHKIEAKDFSPKKTCAPRLCKNCDFRFYCGK